MNDIHPTAVITGDVRLGAGAHVGAHAVLQGPLEVGVDAWIGAGCVVGAPPEVRSWRHPRSPEDVVGGGVRIGDRVVLREGAQVHSGWRGTTVVGDDAFVMNQAYVAHDCVLGDGVTLASSVLLAGHVHVGDRANLGMATTVHQGRRVGEGAMVGMSSVVTRDVPPFAKAYGSPARLVSANTVGMERSGHDAEEARAVASAYEGGDPDLDLLSRLPGVGPVFTRWNPVSG